MKMRKLILVLSILLFCSSLSAQGRKFPKLDLNDHHDLTLKALDYSIDRSQFNRTGEQVSVSTGGLFVAPFVGFAFPIQEFSNNSKAAFDAGVKLEIAHSSFYPFIIGGIFQYQSHEGTDEIKTVNFLSTFNTEILSFGGSVDFILNKYIKSDFTIPFLTLEVKAMSVTRNIAPANFNPGFETSESVIGITGGVGITLYIFDLYASYTYAGDFSTVGINTRFHYPIFKF